MCGIAGLLHSSTVRDIGQNNAILRKMTDSLSHRGPDDAGYWHDATHGIGLGHRRLSVVDLSPNGHQPMLSGSARYIIVFNGEIYNYLQLRAELESAGRAPAWRGHSDTETLLAGFDAWGIGTTVDRAIGMFAFAVWDREAVSLTLVRDRLGEKPLYYGWQQRGGSPVFLFGSELKALKIHPAFEGEIDRGALSLQLRHGCIPSPYSIYCGIAKLPPGCLLTVSPRRREPQITKYWNAFEAGRSQAEHAFAGNPAQAVDRLEALLTDAVQQQMIADVPLGAFLSGGIDSSTVVALMQRQSSRPVKTFAIGFHEDGYNEAEHAKAVAQHLGTDHTGLYVTAQDALEVIPRLPALYDEPFADPSQIPTFLVSQLARRQVTVSLSGDAGDELFGGYNRYHNTARLWQRLSGSPHFLRRAMALGLRSVSTEGWDRLARPFRQVLPGAIRQGNIGHKLHKGAGLLQSASIDALYHGIMSHWLDPAAIVIGGAEPPTPLTSGLPGYVGPDCLSQMAMQDLHVYLPDDILVKVDRAAMGVSLETRVPMLDHRVVEFALRLPPSMKLRDGQAKWVLRQVLYRHVPRTLIDRPKAGFAVPIAHWLRGPLRDWAQALLAPERLRQEGFFEAAPVVQKWNEHLSGVYNWEYHLWNVLMFQAWLEHNRTENASAFATSVAARNAA
ncbi:asparagine synthase (glutamine-hydrolyzing) [Herbaspirillum sp. GCM10030257]|uniref:asparagine synthase (glutamine-hydrolyzing) n=1 Tax=Herbaspirillum sp. GCM10030257 TaxID=3273393 RepID=UPI00360EC884